MNLISPSANVIKILRWTSLVSGWSVLFIGLISCIGWLTKSLALIQLSPHTIIQFNTGIGFVALGLALLSLFWRMHFNLARWLGLLAFLIGFLSILEYAYDVELISQLFIAGNLGPQYSFPGRLAFITAVGLSLGGLAFIVYSKKRPSLILCMIFNILGLWVVCMGVIGILSFFIPIELSFGFIHSQPIAPQTAICFLLLGTGMITASYYDSFVYDIPLLNKIAILLTLFGLTLTLLFGLGLRAAQYDVIHHVTDRVAQAMQKQIKKHLNDYEKDLNRIVVRLSGSEVTPNPLWLQDLHAYVKDHEDIRAIGLINEQLDITHIAPFEEFKYLVGSPLISDDYLEKEDLLTHMIHNHILLIINTPIKEDALLIFVPIYQKNSFKGALFEVIDTPKFLQSSIEHLIGDQFRLLITYQGKELYELNELQPFSLDKIEKPLMIDHVQLRLILAPTPSAYSILTNDTILGLMFFIGLISSLILGGLAKSWRESWLQLQEIENMRERLNIALSSALLGTWTWEIPTDHMHWDSYTSHLLGLPSENFEGHLNDLLSHFYTQDQENEKAKLYKAKELASIYQSEVRVIWPDHTIHTLMFRGSTNKDTFEEITKIAGVCWDISSIREAQKLLETDYLIASILKEAESLESAASQLLEILCKTLDWNLGALWINGGPSNQLKCLAIWHDPSHSYSHFTTTSKQISLAKGMGFPGLIWSEKRPLWIEDIHKESQQPHASEAILDGLHGVFGFPILDERDIIGVIELYRSWPLAEKVRSDLLNLVSSIGHTIAQFYHRLKDEKIQKELASIVEFSRDAIYSRDLDGNIINWNQGAAEIFGYTADEMLGRLGKELVPPDRLKEFDWLLGEAKNGKIVKDYETQRIRKDGQYIWVYMTVSPIRDKTGKVIQICVILQNIDHLKKIEENLRENEEKFRAFIETTSEWVWALNTQRKITYSNPTIYTLLGYTPDEVIGMDAALLLQEDRDFFIRSFDNALQRKKGWLSQILRWHHKDGTHRWLEGNSEIIPGPHGSILGFRGSDRDITERKNLERLKDEFISIVSHELRTPLTSIRGALGLILGRFSSEFSTKASQLLNIAFNNCERLIKIINDILDVEKIEAGKLALQLAPLNLSTVVRDSVEAMQSFAEKFQVTLVIEHLPETAQIYGDYNRLMQVMDNLLSNAIKFSPIGSQVLVSVEILNSIVRVKVKDQGEGIPEAIQSKIFQKFVQAHSSLHRKVSGTGLGLAITKSIIEQLKGSIHFESKLKEGSTFYFELPLWQEEASFSLNHNSLPPSPPILIYEKDAHLIHLLEQQLIQGGFSVETASNIKDAQKLVESKLFRAIILDLDGISNEDLALIENLCKTKVNPHLPLLLTSLKSSKDRQQLINTPIPIMGWIEKPMNRETITEFIKEFKKLIANNKPHILYVEDDRELIEVIKSLLENEAQIDIALSIKEAKEKLTQESYDLVLLDLILPDGNGSALLPCINSQTKQVIPVIIFSAQEQAQQEWINTDFIKQYLIKSRTTNEQLLAIIHSLLKSQPKET